MANTGNTQQQIDYGAAANDGQGDPLRTAFIKTDDNFDAIWNTGPVGSNITILNNTVQSNNTNGNIIIRPNGVGVIQANASILPNTANLRDLGSTGQRWRAAYIGSGGLSVDGNVTVTGNLTAGNISYTGNVFVGDLQGSVYADDSTIMVDAVDNEMFASAVTFGRANVSGNVTANYFVGNGSLLTGITSYANANVLALGEAGWAGNIIPSANAVYSLGNATNYWSNLWVANNTIYIGGVPLGISAGNVLTVAGEPVLSNDSDATITTTGNISANYFIGDGSQLTGISAGTGDFTFSGTTMSADEMLIQTTDGDITLSSDSDIFVVIGDNKLFEIQTENAGNLTFNAGDSNTLPSLTFPSGANISGSGFNGGTASATVSLNAFAPDGNTVSIQAQGNTSSAVIEVFANAGPTTYTWSFDSTGNLTAPGNIRMGNAGASAVSQINTVANSSGDGNGYTTMQLVPDETLTGLDQYLIIDPTGGSPGHIHIRAGGTQDNSSADLFLGGENSYVKLPAGQDPNVQIAANTLVWTFGSAGAYGELTLPAGEGAIRTIDDTLSLVSFNTTTGNANSVYLGSSGGLGFYDQEIGGNWLEIFRSGAEPEIRVPVGGGNLNIQTAEGVNAYNWLFDNTGNLTAPGNITTTGNITGNTGGFAIGYRDIPQVTFSANTTAALADAGKHYYSTTAGNLQLTLPDNSSVTIPTGATLTIVVNAAGNVLVNQGTGVSLYQAGASATGNRVVGAYGLATVMKVAANTWVISGTGVY